MPHWNSAFPAVAAVVAASLFAPRSQAQDLLVDFNSTSQDGGPHNQAGYQAYDAGHEIAGDFTSRVYPAFGTTVTLTPSFPDTTDVRVQQMVDREVDFDASWIGQDLDLLTDWIGVDTRTSSGGNGDYDGTTGARSALDFTLSNLPAGSYTWTSFHHDTEYIHTAFRLEYSVDGGGSFTTVVAAQSGTNSSAGGDPPAAQTYTGTGTQDPATLPSTAEFEFSATAGDDVVVRFTPLASTGNDTRILVVNGFELAAASTGAPSDITISSSAFSKTATVGAVIGTLSTADPTPGDSFSYSLVPGSGDSGNSFFGVSGDNLIVEFDFADFAGGTVYSVRVRSTDVLGGSVERVFPLVLQADFDADDLDDAWELVYFDSLADAAGGGDADSDSLTNAEEEAIGASPVLADSDEDDLDDGVEVSLGTDPTDPDSDGDTIPDGEEVAGARGFVTDPTKADTDGDGYSDAIEIAEGTDPTDGGDAPDSPLSLVLNEILADNEAGITDGLGAREDWIEIFNPNAVAVELDAYFLTDDARSLDKWSFPPVSIPAGGYLVVFASGNDTVDGAGNVHTSFSLDASGEYLALVRPGGTAVDDAYAPGFGNQFPDISFGRQPGDVELRYFDEPTPGAANNTGYVEVVRDTAFSVDRGHYSAPFDVEITTRTEGANIRYTTDGSKPSETVGTIYSDPVRIETTTVLRAIAYKPGALSTNVDAHTYLFVDDISNQPSDPPGWPNTWGTHDGQRLPADYEMDPRVVNDDLGIAEFTIQEALLDIPSVSVSMQVDDFISDATGIYANPQDRVERECSFEFIPTDGSHGIQANCKIEVHGNASRRPVRMHKHSLRLTFSSEVGPGKLRYPLFPQSRVEEFNKLVLRACFTDSWALVQWGGSNRYRPNDSMYMRDVWMKDSMRAMGHASGNGDFVHLYVNGLYFGLHDLTERLEDDWYAAHLGGELTDWEINKDMGTPGTLWRSLTGSVRAAASSEAAYEDVKTKLDIDNYIDYMLLHFYADSEDWPHHNGYAAANAVSGDGRFRFQVWDQEIALDKFTWASQRPEGGGNRYDRPEGSAEFFQGRSDRPGDGLRDNIEFLTDFADRAHKHLFNGGALSEGASIDRFRAICDEIDKAIHAESARWGDIQETVPYATRPGSSNDPDGDFYPPNRDGYFTRENHWVVERDNVLGHYLPTLHNPSSPYAFITELREEGLYPSIDAPEFNQHGGPIVQGFELTMVAEHPIHYTTDGSDPRLTGGAVSGTSSAFTPTGTSAVAVELLGKSEPPTSLRYLVPTGEIGLAWTEPGFDDAGWTAAPAGALGAGYERNASGSYVPEIGLDLRPVLLDVHPSVYLRYEFDAPDADKLTAVSLGMQYDDSFVVYLNGVLLAAATNAPASPAWDSTIPSEDSHEATPGTFDPIATLDLAAAPAGLVKATGNVLAIHGINDGATSSDFLIVPQLNAERTAVTSGDTLALTGSTLVNARALSASGEWSALTRAYFDVGDLLVSEVMYRPATDSRAEFLELTNSGASTLALGDLRFTEGIDFDFAVDSAILTLAPGARLLLVRDLAAFQAVYGNAHDAAIAGSFQNGTSLSNDGETIAIVDSNDRVILSFTYNDRLPWPGSADGGGASLTLLGGTPGTDHADPAGWVPSSSVGGSPGSSGTNPFVGDPAGDSDGDGLSALMEHATGSSDAVADGSPLAVRPSADGSAIFFSYPRSVTASDTVLTLHLANDLTAFSTDPAAVTLVSRAPIDANTELLTYGLLVPPGSVGLFARLQATAR